MSRLRDGQQTWPALLPGCRTEGPAIIGRQLANFSTYLDSNVPITFENDATFAFFGNGKTIATWICGDEEDDLRIYGIDRKPNPKKGYLRKEKAWETVFWRV